MSSLAIALVLLSAVLHATWNAMLKRAPDPRVSAVVIVVGAASLSALLALALGESWPAAGAWPWIVASSLIEAGYFVTLTLALERLPLGTAYGLSRGGGQLIVWPVSILVLHEAAEPLALIGAVVLAAGLFALVQGGGHRAGLVFAGLCAVFIGLYPVAYKAALHAGAGRATLFSLSLAGAVPAQLLLVGKGAWPRLASAVRAAPWRSVLAATLCAVSFLSFLAALELEGAARLTALRNTSVVFAALWGWSQGEPRTVRSLASALAISAGAVLVTL